MGEFELIRRFFVRGGANAPRLGAGAGAGAGADAGADAGAGAGSGAAGADAADATRVALGIGDDCALLQPPAVAEPAAIAVSTDLLLAGRHFFDDVDPESLGHKSLAVNLSDLAAMGAAPRAFTLALALPGADAGWLEAFARGLFALADAHGATLAGGDTTRGPLAVCITVFGDVPPSQALRRDRAREGDDLWVSGTLGAAAWAVRSRLGGRALPAGHPALARLERPSPRVALGLALRGVAHAAIDLSDGLHGDLGHVLQASGVGAELDLQALPIHPCLAGIDPSERLACALAGGDDYELAFTAPPEARERVLAAGAAAGVPLARVGRILRERGLRPIGPPALLDRLPALRSFDHFANS